MMYYHPNALSCRSYHLLQVLIFSLPVYITYHLTSLHRIVEVPNTDMPSTTPSTASPLPFSCLPLPLLLAFL
jgi:hypothetical protein